MCSHRIPSFPTPGSGSIPGGDDRIIVDLDNLRISNTAEPWTATSEVAAGLSREWLPYLKSGQSVKVLAGSALDLSGILNAGAADGDDLINGRGAATVDQDGELSFANGEKARLFCMGEVMLHFPLPANATDSQLQDYVDQVARAGYNAYRPHFLDVFLMEGASQDRVVNASRLDQWKRLAAKLRQKGIYLILDASTSWNSFYSEAPDHYGSNVSKLKRLKLKLCYDAGTREHWRAAMAALFTGTNPYIAKPYLSAPANTALRSDPQIVFANIRNEPGLEFQLLTDKAASPVVFEESGLLNCWRNWLSYTYEGNPTALNDAWEADHADFTAIPLPDVRSATLDRNSNFYRDFRRFEVWLGRETYVWMEQSLRDIGARFVMTDFNNMSDLPTMLVRDPAALVDNHAYADHGSAGESGSGIAWTHENRSSLDDSLSWLRYVAQSRQSGRPFTITEWSQVFWNPFRYEAGLVMPSYAAFQGWSMISQHAGPIPAFSGSAMAVAPADVFVIRNDPPNRASEYMAALLYGRGDVKQAQHRVEIKLEENHDVTWKNNWGLPFTYNMMTLLTGFGLRVEAHPYVLDTFGDALPATATVVNAPGWSASDLWVASNTPQGYVTVSSGTMNLVAGGAAYPSSLLRTKAAAQAPANFFQRRMQVQVKGISFSGGAIPGGNQVFRLVFTRGDYSAWAGNSSIVVELYGNNRIRLGYKINKPNSGDYQYVEDTAELAGKTITGLSFTPVATDLNLLTNKTDFDPAYDLQVFFAGSGTAPAGKRYTGRWNKNSPAHARLTPENWGAAAVNTVQLEAQKTDGVVNDKWLTVSCDEFRISSSPAAARGVAWSAESQWTYPTGSSALTPPSVLASLRSGEILPSAPLNQSVAPPSTAAGDIHKGIYHSDTGELLANPGQRLFRVITPRSEGATLPAVLADGSPGSAEISLDNVSFENKPAPYLPNSAGVLISSLSPDPVATLHTSDRLLLIVSTDALNTGQKFTDYRRLAQYTGQGGTLPVLLRRTCLDVLLRNENVASLKVYPLNPDGSRREPLPTTLEAGSRLRIPIDTGALGGANTEDPSVYYEITVE